MSWFWVSNVSNQSAMASKVWMNPEGGRQAYFGLEELAAKTLANV